MRILHRHCDNTARRGGRPPLGARRARLLTRAWTRTGGAGQRCTRVSAPSSGIPCMSSQSHVSAPAWSSSCRPRVTCIFWLGSCPRHQTKLAKLACVSINKMGGRRPLLPSLLPLSQVCTQLCGFAWRPLWSGRAILILQEQLYYSLQKLLGSNAFVSSSCLAASVFPSAVTSACCPRRAATTPQASSCI